MKSIALIWRLTIIALVLSIPVGYVRAKSVTLSWDADTSASVAGYRVYYGQTSGQYTQTLDAGPALSITIDNLASGLYFFAATAYDAAGNESEYSKELLYSLVSYDESARALDGETVQSATLTWDANTEPTLAGYKVHIGAQSGQYTQIFDVGNHTQITIDGLAIGMWFFAATAYDNDGNESGFSAELMFEVTADTSPTPTPVPTPTPGTGVDPADNNWFANLSDPADPNSSPRADITLANMHALGGMGAYPQDGGWFQLLNDEIGGEYWFQVDWDIYNLTNGETRMATGDLDGDGRDEIIVGFGAVADDAQLPDGVFEILDHEYTHLAWGQVTWDDYNQLNGETWPAAGDIDGDGCDEILIGLGPSGQGNIEVFKYSQTGRSKPRVKHSDWLVTSWEDYNVLSGETRPAAGDVDGDGKDEVVVGLGPVPDVADMPAGFFEIIDPDATQPIWGQIEWDDYNLANGETRPAVGNINNAGVDDIVIGLGPGGMGKLGIFDYADAVITNSGWHEIDWPDYCAVSGETRPALGNIDADAADEMLVGFGAGGQGAVALLDDAGVGFGFLDGWLLDAPDYNELNGATWPVFKRLAPADLP